MTTTPAELQRWMSTPKENEHLEFKEAKTTYDPVKAMRYCIALANEGGGKLVLGVTDKLPRQVVGSHAFKNTGDFQSQILNKLGFRVDIEEFCSGIEYCFESRWPTLSLHQTQVKPLVLNGSG